MTEYNTRQFSADIALNTLERTIFLENVLIARRCATDASLWSLERGMSRAQYLRVLERISFNQMTIAEYHQAMTARPCNAAAYSPFMPV